MATYLAMEPHGAPLTERAAAAIFVRDGFSLLAFLMPPIWLLWCGLWLEAALSIVVLAIILAAGLLTGAGGLLFCLWVLVALYFGLEANGLRLAALRRHGWRDWGPIEARNRRQAETRYVWAIEELDNGAADAPAGVAMRRAGTGTPNSAPALGLLDYPGAR